MDLDVEQLGIPVSVKISEAVKFTDRMSWLEEAVMVAGENQTGCCLAHVQ